MSTTPFDATANQTPLPPAVARMVGRTDLLLVVAFLVTIGLPGLGLLVGLDRASVSEAENRDLAPPPAWSWSRPALAAWPAAFQRYFEDHFAFRTRLIDVRARLLWRYLHMSPTESVIAGRDGWLYYADDAGTEHIIRASPMVPGVVQAWHDTVTATERWLTKRGVAYLFTVAPDKPEIYPEYLPTSVHPRPGPTRTDQVFETLRGTPVAALDLRPVLLEAKRVDRVYHRTDTHWNARGAWRAYVAIIEALRRQRPEIPPAWGWDAFEPVTDTATGHDLARMMGLRAVIGEEQLRLEPKRPRRARVLEPAGLDAEAEVGLLITEIPGSTLPRAVVFRDSFTSALAPFLSEHFSRVVYLWQNDFDASWIEREHADVVIQEYVGRHLFNFIPSPQLVPTDR